jgi:hypothetical protein
MVEFLLPEWTVRRENGIWIGGLFYPSFLMRENERMRRRLAILCYDPDHKTFKVKNKAVRK